MIAIVHKAAVAAGRDYSRVRINATTHQDSRADIEYEVYVDGYGIFSANTFENALLKFLAEAELYSMRQSLLEDVVIG